MMKERDSHVGDVLPPKAYAARTRSYDQKERQEIEGALGALLPRQVQHFNRQHDIIENGPPLQENGALKHHADIAA